MIISLFPFISKQLCHLSKNHQNETVIDCCLHSGFTYRSCHFKDLFLSSSCALAINWNIVIHCFLAHFGRKIPANNQTQGCWSFLLKPFFFPKETESIYLCILLYLKYSYFLNHFRILYLETYQNKLILLWLQVCCRAALCNGCPLI